MDAKQLFDSLTETQRQRLADDLIRDNVLLCQSALIDMLQSKCGDFFTDCIENAYYTDKEGAEWHLINNCDIEEVTAYINTEHNRRCKTKNDIECFVNSCDDDELQDVCVHFGFYDLEKPQDIFEWWAVSDWFADKLREAGQPVLSNEFGTWWGRTCSGQSISCDYTVQMLACEIECEIQNYSAKVSKGGL